MTASLLLSAVNDTVAAVGPEHIDQLADRVKDGTKSNLVGNIATVIGGVLAAGVIITGSWFIFGEFNSKKGNIKAAGPNIGGIIVLMVGLTYFFLKAADVLSGGRSAFGDYLPF